MSGASSSLRQTFVTQGKLQDYMDTNYRTISDSQPAFAYAKDLGQISSATNGTALFAIGHYREPAVQYIASGLSAPQSDRSLYFMTEYPSLESSLSFFYQDYANASSMSAEVDSKLQEDATAAVTGNDNYPALCAIATRQVYGGLEITVGKTASGSYNSSDIMVFVKEIATSNYVNTVDVIAPFFPFMSYMNPDMIEYALLPVIGYVEQGDFPKSTMSAPHDIGSAYPIADGAHQVSRRVLKRHIPCTHHHIRLSPMRHTISKSPQTCSLWASLTSERQIQVVSSRLIIRLSSNGPTFS